MKQQLVLRAGCVLAGCVAALCTSFAEWQDASSDLERTRLAVGGMRADGVNGQIARASAENPERQTISQLVTQIAAEKGVRIISFKDLPPVSHRAVSEVSAEFAAEGAFGTLVALLDAVEGSSSRLRIRWAEFVRPPDRNTVSLQAAISEFYAHEPGAKR